MISGLTPEKPSIGPAAFAPVACARLCRNASASALTQDRFAAQCVLIQVRHTDQTITDRYLSGHFAEVKVSVKFQCKHKSLSPYIKDERLCAFRYPRAVTSCLLCASWP